MIVDRKWVKRNIGFDPVERPAPTNTFAFTKAAVTSDPDDLQREIIDFDSESPAGLNFLAFTTATGLSRFNEIPWPRGLAPTTDKTARKGKGGRLPIADVLVVTWTVDEGHALSRVLTPGKDSRNDYVPYTRNFGQISKGMVPTCPARQAKRLGAYWTSTIGGKRVVVFKSDSHMSQDTKKAPTGNQTLPNEDVWNQIIDDVQPKLVITTGTAGGIGTKCEVGDVVVSPIVHFDCQKWLKKEPFANAQYVFENKRPIGQRRVEEVGDGLPGTIAYIAILLAVFFCVHASVLSFDWFGAGRLVLHFRGWGEVGEP